MRSICPLNRALEIFGDKWSLLILRDIVMFEKSTFKEFMASDEAISSNILADRLQLLTTHSILQRHKNENNKLVVDYSLTEKGKDLIPVIKEIVTWSMKHVTGPMTPPKHAVNPNLEV